MQNRDQASIEFTLLGNGLDFIWSALEYLSGNPGKRELKYAVLHLCSGIELVLKERLQREHWSLVFDKLDSANREDYEMGKFTSVSFNACLKRLTDICEVNIPDRQRRDLLAFRGKRNRMEHFNIVDSVEAITVAASGVLSFLIDFINSELYPESFDKDDVEMLENIRQRLSEFETFVAKRWDAIREDLEPVETAIVTCPSCKQDATMLDNEAHCLFCGYQKSGEEAAGDYISNVLGMSHHVTISDGGEWPLYQCPSCGRETLVNRHIGGSRFPEEEFICFGCGEVWMEGVLDYCDCCGQPYVPGEDKMVICYECFEAKVRADR
ncbi:MAG: hypothetical protein HWN51_05405 [Desulfobacterales bacterium]|nr:hypothetical protein [Desulfobacterales bacterium]